MRTIAIVLGDNDFGNTFVPLLKSLISVLQHHAGPGDLPEWFIERTIKDGIVWHYRAFQLGLKDVEDSEYAAQYLRSKLRVLFDDDAEKDIQEKDHNHGAWYLEIQTGKIYSY